MATTLELRDEVLAHQFSNRYSERSIKFMDKAQKYIVAQTDVSTALELDRSNVDIGVYEYSVPADFLRIKSIDIFDQQDKAATKLWPTSLDSYIQAPDATGRPTNYIFPSRRRLTESEVVSSMFSIYPAPDREYFIDFYYFRQPATLSSTVNPEIPEQYHTLLVDYAVHRCYLSEHDIAHSREHKSLFDEQIMKMRGEVQFQVDDGPVVAEGTWAGTGF